MKKIIAVLAVAALAALSAISLVGCKPLDFIEPSDKALKLDGLELVFEDQFDTLSADSWTTAKYWDSDSDYIRRGGYWDADQLSTADGNLTVRTEYRDGKYGEGWYTGMLNTRGLKTFKYGYFEVRCRAPKAAGLWSAFWMLSDTYDTVSGDGHGGAEIDIMESPYYNDPHKPAEVFRNTTLHTVHIDGYGDDHKSRASQPIRVQNDMYDEFNTYGLLWTENKYEFYINGYKTWETRFGVSDSEQYLILSVEIAGKHSKEAADPANPDNVHSWAGQITDNPPELLPADFVIDYVKVYQ